jgi:hypothetical protein
MQFAVIYDCGLRVTVHSLKGVCPMRIAKRLLLSLSELIIGLLLLGLLYNLLIGRPIILNHYYSKHEISYMSIRLNKRDEVSALKYKELSEDEIKNFLDKYGPYKIFKPLFRKSFIARQDNYNIGIRLTNKAHTFDVYFPLTAQGAVNMIYYTFYPNKGTHKDTYFYLLKLLEALPE